MARATTPKTPAGRNKAQAEFDKYTTRRRAQAAETGPAASAGAAPGPAATAASSPFPGAGLSWAGAGMAPVYIAWKLGLYARAILGERDSGWVRTARTPTGTASS